MSPFGKTVLFAVSLCVAATAAAEPRRRALLIGINDYGAERRSSNAVWLSRGLKNLEGSVNDVHLMRDILLSVYKFKPEEIKILIDGAAGRDAIFNAIDTHLLAGAQKDDVYLVLFAGHGSQVKNSLSQEDDRLDESIVPANAREGAADIRDKELRRRFRPLLDRGARLTIILDTCHSGSGARGLPGGGQARFILPDMRDARDAFRGPTLEDGGTLILSAARDTDLAHETSVPGETPLGVFSRALARALRDAAPNEPAIDTFQRAAARMALEQPDQVPVIAGNAEARFAPFLGARQDREFDRVVVAVRSVDEDGLVTIEGGWANGLTPESELRTLTNPPSAVRLRVIALDGVRHCNAKVINGSASSLQSGSLLELVAWAPPRAPSLRIWVPEGSAQVMTRARSLAEAAGRAGLRWIEDPIDDRPARNLRWSGQGWEPAATLDGLPASAAIFVQIPVLPAISQRIVSRRWNAERVKSPEEADYILTGRLSGGLLQYAWVRPSVDGSDRLRSALPLRTDWHDARNTAEVAAVLTEDLRRLQLVHLWQTLPSPPEMQFNYRLGIRRTRDRALVADGELIAEQQYGFVLRAVSRPMQRSAPRFVYVFMVDSYGKSVLFFPRGPIGSVENRFPLRGTSPAEIPLGPPASLIPEAPFGTDTFFLLSTDEALTNPWILEWDGVRTPKERGGTPLEQLILMTLSGDRGARPVAPSRWSIERVSYATK